MKPLKNVFLVSIDKEADSKIVLSNGVELYIDKEFGEQSNTSEQEHALYNYYRELEAEYTKLHDMWIEASKKGLPVLELKKRLMQIEAEQKNRTANKIIKPFSNAIQWGIVKETPIKVDARIRKEDKAGNVYYEGYFNDVEIKAGDKVYFHHFVSQDDNKVEYGGDVFYKADYSQIICVVRDGEIIPTEKWILATALMEGDEDTFVKVGDVKIFTKLQAEKRYLLSKVQATSRQASVAGFESGQSIVHPVFSEYKINIEGQDMYRMHIEDVYAVLSE